ncbi:hypothetical protein VI26_00365 [Chromobacterium sp. LK1]|nr:hypothetical protein VI26_00365 [Chromobacterium sp. LK1]
MRIKAKSGTFQDKLNQILKDIGFKQGLIEPITSSCSLHGNGKEKTRTINHVFEEPVCPF